MRSIIAILLLSSLFATAENFPNKEESQLIKSLLGKLADKAPNVKEYKKGKHHLFKELEVKEIIWKDAVFTVDIKSGNVIGLELHGGNLPNDKLALLAGLKKVKAIAFGHWGNWHNKKIPVKEFDGSGLAAFSDHNLEHVHAGGSMFSVPGFDIAAKIKSLKSMKIHHVNIPEEKLKMLIGHPNLNSLELSTTCKPLYGNSTLNILVQIPTLEQLSLHEFYLTYKDGLEHLIPLKKQLKSIFCRDSIILQEDIDMLKKNFPDTKFTLHRFKSIEKGHPRNFKKFVPEEVISKFLKES